ncbi:MAG: tRNA (N6-threonylcarbamoyladenosine(37)-N6)-methyltransferase TrmO [Sandaracinus sp.]|nr:tRNA (N6-threonylcarbamoyladenosine(37)-N6)-methyltransferase TrmO [Sandaracinus sp.]
MRFEVESIGVARTPFVDKAEAPRQARAAEGVEGRIELFAGRGFEDALTDLEGWGAIWVIFWMDRATGWRPKVTPPRSRTKRGLFATRAPHRPNPIGLSAVRLERVEGLVVHVRDLDLLDGTPVLDLKPYVPWADAIPDARTGWLEQEGDVAKQARPEDPGPRWEVDFEPLAEAQLVWLAERGVELRSRATHALSLGPAPHAYRRIRVESPGVHVLSLKRWRVRFGVVEGRVRVHALFSGERPKDLASPKDDEARLHAEFVATFGA